MDPITLAWYLLIAILYLHCGLSLDNCCLVLRAADASLRIGRQHRDAHPEVVMPKTVQYVLEVLRLKPQTTTYVCCPECFFLYTPGPEDAPCYPEHCESRAAPDLPPCGRLLRTEKPLPKGKSKWIPTREFLYHDIRHWAAQLYCRPGLEQYLDWKPKVDHSTDGGISDIMESPEIQNFRDSEGQPFLLRTGGQGRLVFGFNEDGFNPYGNKTSGKAVSVGAMYIVCLNLPLSLRYKIENMGLVGVIPGPKSPSLDQMNHMLPPLIADLKILWHEGLHLSKTPRYPNGRHIKGALVPLICDLLAARQVSGFASHSATLFCHLCHLPLQKIDDLCHHNWKPRDWNTLLRHAMAWRDADSKARRDEIYSTYGIRWSPLFELEYWVATKYVMIDPMHNFFLRVLPRHCRQVWGMDIHLVDGEGLSFQQVKNKPPTDVMLRAQAILEKGAAAALNKLRSPVLQQLCRENGLHFGGHQKRGRWLEDLMKLVRNLFSFITGFP